jgi:hypothetical protein
MEPITLFSRIADPAGVAKLLRKLAPSVEIDGPDDSWSRAVVTFGTARKKRRLTISHDPEYYAEPNWSKQMSGMQGYFSRFPETERKERVMMLITTFRFSLGTMFDPDFDPEGDPRLDILFEIAELVDGVLFTPSSLRDARGRVLFGSGEDEEDPDAKWPKVIFEVSKDEPLGKAVHEASRPRQPDEPDDAEDAPSAKRVARRALGMTALTVRAILEQDAAKDIKKGKEIHKDLLEWVEAVGIDDLEPDEWKVVQCKAGKLTDRMQIDSTWRLEGLVVLAWALGRCEIPPHDQLVDFNAMWKKLGIFDVDAAKALLKKPQLRSRSEINAIRNRLFALHWRLRNYGLRPEVMDFAEFAKTCWFGPLDLNGLPLVKGDLAIQGKRIDRASEDDLSCAQSAAQERHQAVNWLWEGPEQYSDASVAT